MENVSLEFLAQNFKNTEMGLDRIRKNLSLFDMSDREIIEHCRQIILSVPAGDVKIRGKNYYLSSVRFGAVLTINKSSIGIITAKKLT